MNYNHRGRSGCRVVSLLLWSLLLDPLAGDGDPSGAAAELQTLQGVWKGVAMSRKSTDGPWVPSADSITITITGNSFHFHRDTNFWFKTTIALLPDTFPKQLRAAIQENAPAQGTNAVGKAVTAIFKIEGGTLTLAARGDGSEETPAGFEDENVTRYELRKSSSAEKTAPLPPQIQIGDTLSGN